MLTPNSVKAAPSSLYETLASVGLRDAPLAGTVRTRADGETTDEASLVLFGMSSFPLP